MKVIIFNKRLSVCLASLYITGEKFENILEIDVKMTKIGKVCETNVEKRSAMLCHHTMQKKAKS